MNATDEQRSGERRRLRRWETAAAAAATVGFALIIGVALYGYAAPNLGPKQPIPFSHRVHAGDKEIGCLVCHPGARDSANAEIPPLQTCLLCHGDVIIHHPEIVKLREHYFGGMPVEWRRVSDLPDHVFFNHSMHVTRQIDCAQCHGEVNAMDRVFLVQSFEMGFCVQCHRDHDVSHACLRCHR
jgi:predicted CXXCH cytochrome family protein